MSDKVLIDTSVWIDFFRGKDAATTDNVAMLLRAGKAVYTGIIALELINGAKGQRELHALQDVFDAMERIYEDEETHFKAGRMGFETARKGHTLSAVDLLIAQIAIENDLALITRDEHFKVIAKYNKMRLINGLYG